MIYFFPRAFRAREGGPEKRRRKQEETRKMNYATYAEQALLDMLPSLPPPPQTGVQLVAGNRAGALPAAILERFPTTPLVVHAFDCYHAWMISARIAEAGFDLKPVVSCAPYISFPPEDALHSTAAARQPVRDEQYTASGEPSRLPCSRAFFHTTPRSMPAELVLDQLEDIHRSLADGASLYAAFEGSADDALRTVKKVFDSVHVLSRGKKAVVFRCVRKAPLAKYRDFSAQWTASVPGGEPLVFTSLPGCFCHRRADPGGLALAEVASRLVVESLARTPRSSHGPSLPRILDMGCGSGLVGLLLADAVRRSAGAAPELTLVDSHARAIAAARINAERFGLADRTRFVLSDDGLPRDEVATHDVFVGNPPYYSEYRIAEIFISTAYRALRPGGTCFAVVKTATGLKALQEKYFRAVDVIPRRGYAVLRSVRQR